MIATQANVKLQLHLVTTEMKRKITFSSFLYYFLFSLHFFFLLSGAFHLPIFFFSLVGNSFYLTCLMLVTQDSCNLAFTWFACKAGEKGTFFSFLKLSYTFYMGTVLISESHFQLIVLFTSLLHIYTHQNNA